MWNRINLKNNSVEINKPSCHMDKISILDKGQCCECVNKQ